MGGDANHALVPHVKSLAGYQHSWLSGDLVAGLTVWAVLVLEALAGAELADSIDADAPSAAEALAAELLDDLPDDSSALVLAIEHLWAVPLRDAVRTLVASSSRRSIPAEDLVTFGMVLGDVVDEPTT